MAKKSSRSQSGTLKRGPIKGPVAVVEEPAEWANLDLPKTPDEIVARLEDRITEIEGDLVRAIQLLVNGDIESKKFKEILGRRQGAAKP